jgi:hypothetical protein
MSKNEGKRCLGVVGRMLLALVFVFSQMAWAGQEPQTRDKSQSPQKAAAEQAVEKQSSTAATAKAQSKQAQGEESESSVAEEKSSRDGSHEGIKVHGHWTIEVKNPDGTVVTHREFENSLYPSFGASFLAQVLGRQITPGAWYLTLDGSVPPCSSPVGGTRCSIFETGFSITITSYVFQTLSSTVGAAGSLILSGTAVAGQNGTIDTVGSHNFSCALGVSLATCLSGTVTPLTPYTFTSATLSPAVNVSPGQTIAVTVNISFS